MTFGRGEKKTRGRVWGVESPDGTYFSQPPSIPTTTRIYTPTHTHTQVGENGREEKMQVPGILMMHKRNLRFLLEETECCSLQEACSNTSHGSPSQPPRFLTFQSAGSVLSPHQALGEHSECVIAPCWTRSAQRSLLVRYLLTPMGQHTVAISDEPMCRVNKSSSQQPKVFIKYLGTLDSTEIGYEYLRWSASG